MGDAAAAIAALDDLVDRLDQATRSIVRTGAEQVQRDARAKAAKRSGENAASIVIEPATNSGPRYALTGVTFGAHAWSSRVGPTTVYGRIREIGGPIPGRGKNIGHMLRWYWNGRPVFKKRVYQHGKPYLEPATETLRGNFRDIAEKRWGEAILSI